MSVPERLTMPTGPPALAMCPAVMPMLDFPGLMMPGQFGPSSRVSGKSRRNLLKNHASSWAGTPSVMHTMNVMPASAASITASFTPGAGMKMHDAVAPVAAIASPTLAKTGMPSTSVPAFLGLVPATTWVPYVAVEQPVEAALRSGEALVDDLRGLVDEDAHLTTPPASATAVRAASSMVGCNCSPSDR